VAQPGEPETGLVASGLSKQALDDLKARLASGKLEWDDLVKEVAAPPEPVIIGKLPMPARITDDELAAIALLPDVYGSFVPTEIAKVSDKDMAKLLNEREILDRAIDPIQRRIEDIKLTARIHSDAAFADGDTDGVVMDADGKTPLRNGDGHIIRKARYDGGKHNTTGKAFSLEPRSGSPSINPEKLRQLAEDPDVPEITHEDYLAMTTQTRVFDGAKAMVYLRKHPELLSVLRRASSTTRPSMAVSVKKAK
jgi:hypothetical protein